MALYTRAQYEKHLEAINAASVCISAAIARSDYAPRLASYIDDYVEIVEMFWAKCPITRKKLELHGPDVTEMATAFLTLTRGEFFGGFAANALEAKLERARRKIRGKLLGTRLILGDNDKKPRCNNKVNHRQPCFCKGLTLANLAARNEQ